MVKKETVNGCRVWREYDPDEYTKEQYELVPDLWDHEHCAICSKRIVRGEPYFENSQRHILCPDCHSDFLRRSTDESPRRDT